MSEEPINKRLADLAILVSPLVIGATGAMFLASYAFDEVQLAPNGLDPSKFSRSVQERIADGAVFLTSGALILLLLLLAASLIGVTIVVIRDWKLIARGGVLAYYPSAKGRAFVWCLAGLLSVFMVFGGELAGSYYGEAQRDLDVMIVRLRTH